MNEICLFHLASINIPAILVSSIACFILGSLWFQVLFGRMWVKELEKHKVVIKKPSATELWLKMGLTFLGNFMTSFAMALLVSIADSTSLCSGLHLGLLVAIGFVATSMGVSYLWVSKSLKLALINIGYPAIGVVASAIILSLWR